MKLQQLRYIWEVCQHGLNVTATAEGLFTSQPSISKQLRQLEEELGLEIFTRNGKQLSELTEVGKAVVALAGEVLAKTQDIRNVAEEYRDNRKGMLSLATTHTQARYVLPQVLKRFIESYPGISLDLHQGTPTQIAEMASQGIANVAIATEALELFDNLIMLPCYRWTRCLMVRHDHPLAEQAKVSLNDLAAYPLITYVFGFTGRSKLDNAFNHARLHPNIVLTAVDADVIKTYVRLGLGVGIVAKMAYNPEQDKDLLAIDAGELFGSSITSIGLRRDMFIRGFVYDFIEMFAPHLNRERVDAAMKLREKHEREALFRNVELPCY